MMWGGLAFAVDRRRSQRDSQRNVATWMRAALAAAVLLVRASRHSRQCTRAPAPPHQPIAGEQGRTLRSHTGVVVSPHGHVPPAGRGNHGESIGLLRLPLLVEGTVRAVPSRRAMTPKKRPRTLGAACEQCGEHRSRRAYRKMNVAEDGTRHSSPVSFSTDCSRAVFPVWC